MAKEHTSGPAATCQLDSTKNHVDVRAPLRIIPAQAAPKEPSVHSETKFPEQQRWPSPSSTSKEGKTFDSFELEDNTTGSGGTSWTLRVPWLRNKRPRKQQLDDENCSIGTDLSRSINKSLVGLGSEDRSGVYYGGLMKTGSPTFVSVEAEQIEALEGDGLYRTEFLNVRIPPNHTRQQRRNSRKTQKPGSFRKERQSSKQEMKQDLLTQQHNPPQPLPVDSEANIIANGNTRRSYFLSNAPDLVPKNNNKVFRNRSWISTSSRESEGRKTDDDSLADFDETEWTPQDSAYGAAIPVCGWVPKRLRQGIEATVIAITVFALVYLVVTTSINISESKTGGTYHHVSYNDTSSNSAIKGYDGRLAFDDDYYVENSQYQNDEDDYFSNNNNGGGKGNNNQGG